MKVSIDVDGKTYIPVAAVPYVTNGFFTVRDVIIMAAVPGLFAHAYGGTALDVFEFLPFGVLTYVAEKKLSPVADICIGEQREPPLHKIAGMVVPAEDLRDMMQTISGMGSAPWKQQQPRPPASWDMEASLPLPVMLAITKNLPVDIDLTVQRADSVGPMRRRIEHADISAPVFVRNTVPPVRP